MTPPDTTPLAGLLAAATLDLVRGSNVLVVADKGWVPWLCREFFARLRAAGRAFEYLDGRPALGSQGPDPGIVNNALVHLRRSVRGDNAGTVTILPHLDLMASTEGGWTATTRETVALLYEDGAAVFLGFRDPSLPLVEVAQKAFHHVYTVDAPFLDTQRPDSPSAA